MCTTLEGACLLSHGVSKNIVFPQKVSERTSEENHIIISEQEFRDDEVYKCTSRVYFISHAVWLALVQWVSGCAQVLERDKDSDSAGRRSKVVK